MDTVIDSYNPGGVDETVLRGRGSGGLLADGYLRDDPLESYLGDDETPVFVRSNSRKGVLYEALETGERDQIRPGDGYRAFMLVTDTRLLFVVGDSESRGNDDYSVAVPLSDVQLVDGSEGMLSNEIAVTTLAEVRWRFPCTDAVGDLLSYLEVATAAWKHLERHLGEAREHLLDANAHREAGEYDTAVAALDAADEDLTAARRREAEFVSTGVTAMQSRIERIENRVDEARLATLEARATRALDRAERLWREDGYADAHDAFRAARSDYAGALDLADALDFADAEKRDTLRTRLDRVERNITALERAPVERADRARDRADGTDDPDERVTLLEQALERYRRALELDWGREEKRFVGETDELRDQIDAVAVDLVETRRRLADTRISEGDRHREDGRPDRAADRYREARDLLDAALATARELVPDAVDPVTDRREAVVGRLRDLDREKY